MSTTQQAVLIQTLNERLAEIARLQGELAIERRLLEDLIRRAVPIGDTPSDQPIAPVIATSSDKPGPRDAIIAFVRENPGLTPTEIADRLADTVASEAKDKRNVLRTTVAVLVKQGALTRSADNKHYPPEYRLVS